LPKANVVKFDPIIDDLSSNALLGLMETEALRLIAFSTDLRHFDRGEEIYRVGEAADGAWFIHSGTVTVQAGGDVETFGGGSLLGENALIAEGHRLGTAVAADEVAIRFIPRVLMHRVLSEFPESAGAAQGYLAQKVAVLQEQLAALHAILPDERV
jgi:CRP-like cAMP-binding protein